MSIHPLYNIDGQRLLRPIRPTERALHQNAANARVVSEVSNLVRRAWHMLLAPSVSFARQMFLPEMDFTYNVIFHQVADIARRIWHPVFNAPLQQVAIWMTDSFSNYSSRELSFALVDSYNDGNMYRFTRLLHQQPISWEILQHVINHILINSKTNKRNAREAFELLIAHFSKLNLRLDAFIQDVSEFYMTTINKSIESVLFNSQWDDRKKEERLTFILTLVLPLLELQEIEHWSNEASRYPYLQQVWDKAVVKAAKNNRST